MINEANEPSSASRLWRTYQVETSTPPSSGTIPSCPAFVADCLETIEEIGMQARASFLEHGGEEFRLVPSLNAHPRWIETAAELVRAAV